MSYDPEKRICNGICKKYTVKKPVGVGRYASGQARCQICDVWLDHNGCITKNRKQAVENTIGWICKCCNYKVRQKPRNLYYKEKMRESLKKNNSD